MSFELPPQHSSARGKRRKGGGFFMLILLGIGMFIFMNVLRGGGGQKEQLPQQQGSAQPAQQSEYQHQRDRAYERTREKIFGKQPQEQRKRMPEKQTAGNDGWSINDAGSSPVEQKANTKTTTKGDWSIGEVDGKKKKSQSDFRLNGDATGQKIPAAKSKRTEAGDWSAEQVETKEAPRKKEKSDW